MSVPLDTVAARQLADRALRLLVDTARQEPLELLALLVEDAERRVASARELTRGLEDPLENHVELEPSAHSASSSRRCRSGRSIAIYLAEFEL